MITIYALFMCLQAARPGIGHNCILISQYPMRQYGRPYTRLADCQRDMKIYRNPPRGYEMVCMSKQVPAWGN